ncbi:HET-domain-containing protein [Acephala macrosclerotiorum]|nr:HET-domain-containing protein [Acephala macrosclerotiorum]
MTKHDECPGKSSGPAMTRLLDVGSSDDQSTIRLVETINLPGNDFSQWVALSYSWGGEQRLKTTRESIVSHREGIDLTILPQTIQDAVFVCRKIGVSYLWVDCLCIIQNDERDLERELAQMPYIYQGALVTIYAASARSVQDGFLQQRPLYYKEFPPIKLRFESSSDREDYLVLAEWVFHHYQDRGERDDPLDRRAWAFQERMLSPRLLVYSSRELTWQCRHGDRRVGNTRTDYTSSVIWRDRHDLPCVPGTEMPRWESIVQKYTRCSLTLPSDKLVAIAGVADVYRREHRMTYEAGLWKEDMPISLCWYVKSSGIQKIVREYRAPSWSWASVDGEISWEGHSYSESMVTLIDAETTPLFPAAPLAAVISGSLTLRGRMLPAILNFLVGENGIVHDVELRGILFAGGLKVNIDCLEQTWYESHSVKLDIWLLLIAVFAPVLGNFGGLVLRETSGGAYRRIGLFSNTFSILPYDDIFPGSLLEKEIKIE